MIESLNKAFIEQEKLKNCIIKDRDEQKKKNENFEKIDRELSENLNFLKTKLSEFKIVIIINTSFIYY